MTGIQSYSREPRYRAVCMCEVCVCVRCVCVCVCAMCVIRGWLACKSAANKTSKLNRAVLSGPK